MNINEFARALKSYVESQPSKSENGDAESLLELLFDVSTPLEIAIVAKVCPYGIITTNRESPEIPTVFGILPPDSSFFSNPKNQAE